MSRVNGRGPGPTGTPEDRVPEEWDREGVIENIVAPGINLYHYTDFKAGIAHYVLVMLGAPGQESYRMDRQFHWKRDREAKLVLDGAKALWENARKARAAGDEFNALALTYKGLRLVFPQLPEGIDTMKGFG